MSNRNQEFIEFRIEKFNEELRTIMNRAFDGVKDEETQRLLANAMVDVMGQYKLKPMPQNYQI